MKLTASGVIQLNLVISSFWLLGLFLMLLSIKAKNLICVFALFAIHEKLWCNDIGLISLNHTKVTKCNTFFQILFCFLICFYFFDMHAVQDLTHMETHTYIYTLICFFSFLSYLLFFKLFLLLNQFLTNVFIFLIHFFSLTWIIWDLYQSVLWSVNLSF